jgi:predicted nucleic acid-binding protein
MSDVEPNLCFIDTNVWLYAFIQSQDQSKSAIAKAIIQRDGIVISSQVINEVCVNLIRKARFDEASIRQLIESFYDKYQVAEIGYAVIIEASSLRERYGFSYWDSLIVACALSEQATTIYSEDMHSGLVIDQRLRVINPFADQNAV